MTNHAFLNLKPTAEQADALAALGPPSRFGKCSDLMKFIAAAGASKFTMLLMIAHALKHAHGHTVNGNLYHLVFNRAAADELAEDMTEASPARSSSSSCPQSRARRTTARGS